MTSKTNFWWGFKPPNPLDPPLILCWCWTRTGRSWSCLCISGEVFLLSFFLGLVVRTTVVSGFGFPPFWWHALSIVSGGVQGWFEWSSFGRCSVPRCWSFCLASGCPLFVSEIVCETCWVFSVEWNSLGLKLLFSHTRSYRRKSSAIALAFRLFISESREMFKEIVKPR